MSIQLTLTPAKLTERETVILDLIRNNPGITTAQIQRHCLNSEGIGNADRYCRFLQVKGYIEGTHFEGGHNQKRWRIL